MAAIGTYNRKKRCTKCFKCLNVYLTCFKCDAVYHAKCLLKVPRFQVDQEGRAFCCQNITLKEGPTKEILVSQGKELVIVKREKEYDSDKAGSVGSFRTEENFQKEPHKQSTNQCDAETNHSRLNEDNEIWVTNEKRDLESYDNKEKKHKCTVCNYSSRLRGGLAKHMRIHDNERPLTCDYVAEEGEILKNNSLSKHCDEKQDSDTRVCVSSAPLEDTFGKHPQVDGTERPFKCDLYDYAAAKRTTLTVHIKAKHSNAEKGYKCPDCTYSTYRKWHLLRHKRIHTNGRPFMCDKCDYAAIDKTSVSLHFLVKHSNTEKMYKCPDCEYSSYRKWHLVRHKRSHANGRPFKCAMCDYAAADKTTLSLHILSKHSNTEKMFKCPDCNYSSHRNCDLLRHKHIHTHEGLLKSDTCDYAAGDKSTPDVHILANYPSTVKKYTCTDCKYSTYKRGDLVKHIRIHTNERPFKCDMCDYASVARKTLSLHILAKHSNAEKMYKCTDCNYSSYTKGDLLRHKRIHTNEKPFKCDICNYAAARRSSLNIHNLTKHWNMEKNTSKAIVDNSLT